MSFSVHCLILSECLILLCVGVESRGIFQFTAFHLKVQTYLQINIPPIVQPFNDFAKNRQQTEYSAYI